MHPLFPSSFPGDMYPRRVSNVDGHRPGQVNLHHVSSPSLCISILSFDLFSVCLGWQCVMCIGIGTDKSQSATAYLLRRVFFISGQRPIDMCCAPPRPSQMPGRHNVLFPRQAISQQHSQRRLVYYYILVRSTRSGFAFVTCLQLVGLVVQDREASLEIWSWHFVGYR
jgi:hypothetical protein